MKSRKYGRWTSLALACIMALTLFAGCSSGGDGGGTGGEAPSVEGGGGGASPAASGSTLLIWNVMFKTVDDNGVIPTDQLIFNRTIREFEEEHGVAVEVVNQTYDNVYQLFQSAGLAKNGPDIATLWSGGYTNDYRDFIEPLDSYFTEEELSKFPNLDLCRVDFQADGALLGIPTDMTTLNLFYNKAAFREAGLDESAQFANFTELLEACADLADAGYQPFAMQDSNGYTSAWVVGEFLTHRLGPVDMFKLQTGELKMSESFAVEAMEEWSAFCNTLLENGWVNADAFTTASEEAFVDMYTGKAAMRFGGSWDCDPLFNELGDDVGTMRIPAYSGSEPYADHITAQFSNNFVVTGYSGNKELAVELVKQLSSAEFYRMRYEQEQALPARLDVNLAAVDTDNPLGAVCYGWIQADKNVVGFDAIISADSSAEFYRLAPTVITGNMSAPEAMEAVQEKNSAR